MSEIAKDVLLLAQNLQWLEARNREVREAVIAALTSSDPNIYLHKHGNESKNYGKVVPQALLQKATWQFWHDEDDPSHGYVWATFYLPSPWSMATATLQPGKYWWHVTMEQLVKFMPVEEE